MLKVYVTHSTSYDYVKDLYMPIKKSLLFTNNKVVLPHEGSEFKNSFEIIKASDLIIGEVSYQSTGQGIELGWANVFKTQIKLLCKKGFKPPGSLAVLNSNILFYSKEDQLIDALNSFA